MPGWGAPGAVACVAPSRPGSRLLGVTKGGGAGVLPEHPSVLSVVVVPFRHEHQQSHGTSLQGSCPPTPFPPHPNHPVRIGDPPPRPPLYGGEGTRIASSNNMNKSESDQEDNDDINDNDWSYGSEKKAKKRKSDKNPNSPRRSKSLKHKNGEISGNPDPFKYSNSAGINYETLGPEELRTLLTTQCGVISEHTKKMCTRSLRCPQHTDEQRRSVRVYLLGPSASLPEAEGSVENDSFEVAESQAIMSRLQWDGSSDISPSDSASSKASTNNSESRKTKKKKPHLGLVSGAPGLSSSKKKKPKPPAPHTPSIYDDIN
ncbi:ataxin-7-like protein 3 [Sarcoramphus papa]